ncbi:MAG: hypothetical protein LBB76_04065 [Azoarcus sp.]|jgi:hypothetical protein|nr:hypothetical protein [Azoarcus sp.]
MATVETRPSGWGLNRLSLRTALEVSINLPCSTSARTKSPQGQGFVTRRMLSDKHLPAEITASTELSEYTGKYDCVSDLRQRTYPEFARVEIGAAVEAELVAE